MAVDFNSVEYKKYMELEKRKSELKYTYETIKEKLENNTSLQRAEDSLKLRALQQEYAEIEKELKKNPAAKEFAKIEKRQRKKKFNEVKEAYKKANGSKELKFTHLIDKITMRGPKWGKIKKYSSEQLDYLLDSKRGETFKYGMANNIDSQKVREFAENFVKKTYPNLSDKEKRKEVESMIYREFSSLLGNEEKLNEYIENSKKGKSM